MLSLISGSVSKALISNCIISEEDEELYRFGIEMLLMKSLHFITILAIGGFLFKMLPETIIYLASFIPLRSYAGGYHAKSRTHCYIISCLMVIAALFCVKFIPGDYTVICGVFLLAVSSCLIICLAPKGSANKELDELETKVFRRKTLIILSFLCISAILILFWVPGLASLGFVITLSVFSAAALLVM